ncbi:MAG TPA: hypothetical protein ENH82_13920 [bacterium]|nr:hypothetical protein [bacterium]
MEYWDPKAKRIVRRTCKGHILEILSTLDHIEAWELVGVIEATFNAKTINHHTDMPFEKSMSVCSASRTYYLKGNINNIKE